MNPYIKSISSELSISSHQVSATIDLLEAEGTVPFIARYRKEATGGLDEVQIINIRDRFAQLKELDKRRAAILKSIDEQKKLTPELKKKIEEIQTLTALEDLYLPYKPKRKTKGSIALEQGLEPLAKIIFEQNDSDPLEDAKKFINKDKKIETTQDALQGARNIIAEWINENTQARSNLRDLFSAKAVLTSKVIKSKKDQAIKYQDYFELSEVARTTPSHRMLAIRRGEKEGFLMMSLQPDETEAIQILQNIFIKGTNKNSDQVQIAIADSYKRLLSLSLETELRIDLKKKADEEAIENFKKNLRQLLMEPPLGFKNVLAIDPGLRTGCKIVCLNNTGDLVDETVIYLSASEIQREDAKVLLQKLCIKHKIEVIAVGNGTAGRETEQFVKDAGLSKDIIVILTDECGASIYSASEAAREEFPDYDITVRGAVSIGRRLMDPLAELVKIDAKSIGVGQYQYDVDQKKLKNGLDDVVVSCVNQVGVQINSASKQLLSYVSGVGPTRAKAIITHRNKNGSFSSREDFHKIAGFGPKVFEQAAGFLRIADAPNPLDASAVHPERYDVVQKMALDLKCDIQQLISNESYQKKINVTQYTTDDLGIPTLNDIVAELAKPGIDPREEFELFTFKDELRSIDDITVGMELPGVVTNVTNFGAFVDIGIKQHGLIHISQMSNTFVKDPQKVVKVHQKVNVTVIDIDTARDRIALSLVGKKEEVHVPKKKEKKEKRTSSQGSFTNNPFKDLKL